MVNLPKKSENQLQFFFSNCHNLISQFLKFWGKCLAQHKYGIMYLPVVWNWIESCVVWTSVLKGFTVRANKPLPKKCFLKSDELDFGRVIIIYKSKKLPISSNVSITDCSVVSINVFVEIVVVTVELFTCPKKIKWKRNIVL